MITPCAAAAVWRGQPVAVKVMLASHGDHAAELESFRQEVIDYLHAIRIDAPALEACIRRPTLPWLRRSMLKAPCCSRRDHLACLYGLISDESPILYALLTCEPGAGAGRSAARAHHLPAGGVPGAAPHLHRGGTRTWRVPLRSPTPAQPLRPPRPPGPHAPASGAECSLL